MGNFEAILMTTYRETDEYIAVKRLAEITELIEKIEQRPQGEQYTEEELKYIMKLYLDVFWVYSEIRTELSNIIHQIGMNLEKRFRCKYSYSDKKNAYYLTCPAILLHYDYGFSFDGTEKYECSICRKPVIECEHITGDLYDNITCNKINSRCNICNKEKCEHIANKKYNRVKAIKIVYNMKANAFALVKNPEMKFSRITKEYLSEEDIIGNLTIDERKIFKFGITELYCHHCSQCNGYNPN